MLRVFQRKIIVRKCQLYDTVKRLSKDCIIEILLSCRQNMVQ